MIPGSGQGFAFNPQGLDDQELQKQINDTRNQVTYWQGGQQTPTGLGLINAATNRLQALQQELQTRQIKAQAGQQQGQIQGIYDQALRGAPAFDTGQYIGEQNKYAQAERGAVGDVYRNQLAGALQGIQQNYIPQKQGLAEDLAAQGLLNQGNSRYSLNALEAQKARDVANTYSQLGAEQGRSLTGVEQGLGARIAQGQEFAAGLGQQERGLQLNKANQLANYLQGGSQFGQQFGLAQNKFNYDVGQNAFNNQADIFGLQEASRLGNLQAQAQRPTGLQQFGQVASGLGGLIGGIGGLATGLKGLASAGQIAGGVGNLTGSYGRGNYSDIMPPTRTNPYSGGGDTLRQQTAFYPRKQFTNF